MADRILSQDEIGIELARLDPANRYLIGYCQISALGINGPTVKYYSPDLLLPMAQFSERILQPLVRQVAAVQPLLDRRGATHGDYRAMSVRIQQIKNIMRMGSKWIDMPDPQKEALELIATKIGRIIEGDPEFKDHWDDLSGYAIKASEFCRKETTDA